MKCSIHNTPMTQLFTSWVCDLCSPAVGQFHNKAMIPTAAGSVKDYGPCSLTSLTFLACMQQAVKDENRARGGAPLHYRDISILIGANVWNAWLGCSDIMVARANSHLSYITILAGYLGDINGSPTYCDVGHSQLWLHPDDIYMTNWKFTLDDFKAGNVIKQALLHGVVVLHSIIV